jgi:hypothetical protein
LCSSSSSFCILWYDSNVSFIFFFSSSHA